MIVGFDRGIFLVEMRDDALHVVGLRRAVNHEAAFLGGSLRQVIGGGLYPDVEQQRNDVYGRNTSGIPAGQHRLHLVLLLG